MAGARLDMDDVSLNARFKRNTKEAQVYLDNEVIKDTDPYVPADSLDLARSALSDSNIGEGKVIYGEGYAGAQYYSKPHKSKDMHPMAQQQWFEESKSVNKKKWIQGVKVIGGKE